MWPLVVDTKFINSDPRISSVNTEIGKPASLSTDAGWNVEWTVKQGDIRGNGFDALIAAQKGRSGADSSNLKVNGSEVFVMWDGTKEEPGDAFSDEVGNVIRWNLDPYTVKVCDKGPVVFKLKYIPFNLTGTAANWEEFKENSKFFNLATPPVWIIRTG